MRIKDLMSVDVRTTVASTAAASALGEMKTLGIHHLVVVEGKDVVGLVSERDLGGRRGTHAGPGQTVADVMTPNPVTAAPDMTVRRAANLLRGRMIGCLPVLEGRKLVGILTISDVLDAVGRGDLGRSEHVLTTFAGRRFVANR